MPPDFSEFVTPIAMAGVAAGADGIIVEVHPDPQHALSDGRQSLKPDAFADMVVKVGAIADAVGRTLVPVKLPAAFVEVVSE